MARKWIEFEQRQHGPNGGDYISLNGFGEFWINNVVFEKIGRPEAVTLHFDPESNSIGMQRSEANRINALRVRKRESGAWGVRSLAFMRKWDIRLTGTYLFPEPQIEDDMLVLPLNTRFSVTRNRRR